MKLLSRKAVLISFLLMLPLGVAYYFYPESEPASPVKAKPKRVKMKVNPYWDSLTTDFAREIEHLMAETGIPGASVVVVHDTTVLFQQGFGLKTIGESDSVDDQTVFRIGSVSKCFAAVLTTILVRDGLLQWDDPVVKYLPGFYLKSPEQTALLSLRHVLSHTTGLPYHTYTTLIEDGADLKDMLVSLKDVDGGPVGSIYSYQNVAFSIIGEVIESATGKPYDQVLRERIFEPLQMNNASTSYDAIIRHGNIAHPHLKRRRSWKEIPISDRYYNALPAGGINASADDMGKWLMALLGCRPEVIGQTSIDQIFTPVVQASSKNRSYRKVGKIVDNYYGLGWRILHFPADTLVYHGGYVNGYRSEVAVYQKDKLAICVLANAPGDVADLAIPLFMELYLERREEIQEWNRKNHLPALATRSYEVAGASGG